jgi:hypothetical protein
MTSGLLDPAIEKGEYRAPTIAADDPRKFLKELAWRRNPSKS